MSYILYDFSAIWCNPCRSMKPVVEKVVSEFPNVQLKIIDVDEDTEVSTQYRIRSVPTFVLLKDNQIVGQLVGATSADKFREFILHSQST